MVDERFAPGSDGKWYVKSHFTDAPKDPKVCECMGVTDNDNLPDRNRCFMFQCSIRMITVVRPS